MKNKTIVVICLFFVTFLFSTPTFASDGISLTVSSNDIVLDLLPKTNDGTFAKSSDLNISVTMSGVGGYTLGIRSSTTGGNSTKLINNNDNSKYFSSITSAVSESDFSDVSNISYNNKWGYNPSKYHSVDNTNFHPAPDENGDILDSTSAPNASGNYTISIGARANIDTAVGQYVGTVVITAVANITCNSSATIIGEAVCMQDMNDGVINSMEMGTQYQLIDNRDGKRYYIAKMKDGRVWMTQNLDLDLEVTPNNVAALTSENTDLNTFGSHNYTVENGYTCSNSNTTTNCAASGEIITWSPLNTTQSSTWTSDDYIPYSSDVGETYYYVNDDGTTSKYYSTLNCEANHDSELCAHYHAGNYYNFTAAVASNSSSGIPRSTVMENSVCPAGWRLPYGQLSSDATNWNYYAEMAYSWYAEGTIVSRLESGLGVYFTDGGWLKMRKAPLYIVASGNLYFSNVLNGDSAYMLTNALGYQSWGAHITRIYQGQYINFSGDTIQSRRGGGTIRCVARQNNTGSTIVSFDKNANDAVGTMPSQTISSNTINTLSPNNYSRQGYVFSSWNTEVDGSGDTYTDAAEYYAITGSATNEVTLYAQWEKLYTITFNIGNNASSISFDGVAYTNGQSTQAIEGHIYVIGGNYPTKYSFNSWAVTAGALENTAAPATNYTVTGDATITLTGREALIDMTTLTNSGAPSSNCKNESVTPQLVYDPRDNEAYWVAQLCDGKIWMLDNLRLDLTNSTIINGLSSSNTNASDIVLNYLRTGGGATNDQYPTSNLSGSQWISGRSYSRPLVRSSFKNDIAPVVNGLGSGKIGVYYNYCAASAGSYCWGNGTSSTNSPTTDPNESSLRDIDGDICPIGWHLPTGGNNNSSEYNTLYTSYQDAAQGQKDAFLDAFSTSTSGRINAGSQSYINSEGVYLSSTWNSATNMGSVLYSISSTSLTVSTNTNSSRNNGYQVRCVLNDF